MYYTIRLENGPDVTPDDMFRKSSKGRRSIAQRLANENQQMTILRLEHYQVSRRRVWFFNPE